MVTAILRFIRTLIFISDQNNCFFNAVATKLSKDFTLFGDEAGAADFGTWLRSLPYAVKIVVLGNHEGHQEARRLPADGRPVGERYANVVERYHRLLNADRQPNDAEVFVLFDSGMELRHDESGEDL